MARYAMSKFANILFTYELQRRLKQAESGAIAVACHLGGSATELGEHSNFRHDCTPTSKAFPKLFRRRGFTNANGSHIKGCRW